MTDPLVSPDLLRANVARWRDAGRQADAARVAAHALLRPLREGRRRSVRDVAARAGVAPGTLSAAERWGQRRGGTPDPATSPDTERPLSLDAVERVLAALADD